MALPGTRAEAWFDDLAEGVVLVAEDRIAFVNRSAGEMLGVDPQWAIGKHLISVLRDHRLEHVWLDREQARLTLRGRLLEAVPITGGIALRDVSQVHQAQEDARELLAVLSHELRTPLTTVRSTLEALEYEDLPRDTRKRLLDRAVEEANRVVRLLGDLTVDVNPQRERSISLQSTVERACAIVAATLEESEVKLRPNVDGVTVWADPDKVLQVLINMIENAAVYGPKEAQIDVEFAEFTSWGLIMVRDRGSALAREEFDRLFEPFNRGTSANGRGKGLGLYVVRSIAERWGGFAWGRAWRPRGSSEPAGNEFGVAIPLNRGANSRPAPHVDLAGLDDLPASGSAPGEQVDRPYRAADAASVGDGGPREDLPGGESAGRALDGKRSGESS